MNKNGANRTIGAVVGAAMASGAIYAAAANAQNSDSALPAVAVQRVAVSAPGTRSDRVLVAEVRRAFRRVPQLDASGIDVRANRGFVTLRGWVPQSWQISRAGSAARSVHGVRAVTNQLRSRD
ncbi:MAG TPA: BON domain-containing protein [Paraburkholderia sp.]|jgi:osmotically-inducible protein OsmY